MTEYAKSDCPDCGRLVCTRQMGRHRRTHSDPRSLMLPTDEQMAEMARLYQRHSMREVARLTHWSVSCVQRTLAITGIPIRPMHTTMHPKRVDSETLLKTAELYGKGLTMEEISGLMGCSLSTVHRRLTVAGTQSRPQTWRKGRPWR